MYVEVVQPPLYTSLQLQGRRLGHCSSVKCQTTLRICTVMYIADTFLWSIMSTSRLICLPMTAGHCCKCYHQQKMAWEEHVDSLFHSISQSDHILGHTLCPTFAWLTFNRSWCVAMNPCKLHLPWVVYILCDHSMIKQ